AGSLPSHRVGGIGKVLQCPWGFPRRLRVAVVVDDNSTTALRWKPFQVSAFWRRYCIDEGQDFTPAMLRSLALAIPSDGSLTFFGDMAQQIYGNRISWRMAGLHPAKPWEFRENYRNTRQIAALCLALTKTAAFKGTVD